MNKLISIIIALLLVAGCSAPIQEVVEEPLLPAPIFRDPPFTPIYYWLPVAEVTIEEFETGRIIIPAIKVDIEPLQGNIKDIYDKAAINRGPVLWHNRSPLSTNPGNTIIGGHRNGNRNFHYLHNLEPGDLIYIEVGNYQFTYVVESQTIKRNNDWSAVNAKPNYPALTLMTCEPKNDYSDDPPYRLYIRARLQVVLTK